MTPTGVKAALHIQNGKKRGNEKFTIRKVFLIDDEAEVAVLSGHLEEQRQIGVELQYMYRHEINDDHTLAADIKKLGSVDFGVFDDEHILVWTLEQRAVKGGRVLFGNVTVAEYRAFFDHLFEAAKAKHGQEVLLLPLSRAAHDAIDHWPAYNAPFTELSYALRAPTGWLYTFGANPKCGKFGVYVGGELVGFTLLDQSGKADEAEFYVAIHPQKLAAKNGRKATEATLRYGFAKLALKRIFLKVRKDHAVGKDLYTKIGFVNAGEKKQEINGKMTDFDVMDLTGDRYRALQLP